MTPDKDETRAREILEAGHKAAWNQTNPYVDAITQALQQVRAEERGRARGLKSALCRAKAHIVDYRTEILTEDGLSNLEGLNELKLTIHVIDQALAQYDAEEGGG